MSEPKSEEQKNLEKNYEEYVKQITPTHNLYLQMLSFYYRRHYLYDRTGSFKFRHQSDGDG